MKNLKITMIILAMFGTLISVSAQRVIKVYPAYGTVVTTIYKPKLVVHRGTNFHFANGVWYRAQGRKYVVCAAPVGISVRFLPKGNRVVYHKGRRLYTYKGVWYKKRGRNYIVVNV